MKITEEQTARMVELIDTLPFEVMQEVFVKVHKERSGK